MFSFSFLFLGQISFYLVLFICSAVLLYKMNLISCIQTDDEKAMLKVSVSDIKHFLQWKGASVVKKVWLTQTHTHL